MRKPKAKPAPTPFRPCNRNGCMSGMVRVIRDGNSAVRECECARAWRAARRLEQVDPGKLQDGKSAAAHA